MWSRKKRKKEKEESNPSKTGKPKYQEDSAHSSSSNNRQELHPSFLSRPTSSSPISDRREGSQPPLAPPPSNHRMRGYSAEPPLHQGGGIKHQLSVPLPSAPLSVGILESLTSSLVEGSNSAAPPTLVASTTSQQQATLQVKQVIAEAQRSLINQLQQQLEGSVPQPPSTATATTSSLATVPGRQLFRSNNQLVANNIRDRDGGVVSGVRHTLSFDYGNQSNKVLEEVADEQLKRSYYQEWDM